MDAERAIGILKRLKIATVTMNVDGDKVLEPLTMAIEALKEKQERDNTKQWLDDMNNPFEPIKVESALQSEIMKMNYRKEHKPDSISVLDYTIIAVLAKELGIK